MSRDILLSLALHVVLLAAALVSAPLAAKKKTPFEEVIRVQLTAPGALPIAQPAVAEPVPVAVPTPVVEETPDIPISSPETVDEPAVVPEKPKPKPKPKSKPEAPQEQPAATASGSTGEAEGEKTVEAPVGGGSPFAGATIDNVSFDYPYWFTQAFNKIGSNYHIRIEYGRPLVCVIYFQVIRSGRLVDARIEQSSGDNEFDDVCLRSVQNSAPFPPLPGNFVDEIIGITIPFKYDPR